MKYPAEIYAASTRRYDGLPELTYPFHDRDVSLSSLIELTSAFATIRNRESGICYLALANQQILMLR